MNRPPFEENSDIGAEAAGFLDQLYMRCLKLRILRATYEEQLRGIDRWFLYPPHYDNREPIDYKRDQHACHTGNLFAEKVANDQTNKKGWVLTTEALWVLYYLPTKDLIYWLDPKWLREKLPEWEKQYGPLKWTKPQRNAGYRSGGICVPLEKEIAPNVQVVHIADFFGLPPLPSFCPLLGLTAEEEEE